MNVAARRAASALGLIAVVALLIGGAAATALALKEQQANVDSLTEQSAALEARAKRLTPRSGRDPSASRFFEARTITLAGAAVQQRLESAVSAARGRLASSKVEVGPRGDERRLGLTAELTIAQPDLQALLFDLETGRPYLFVDSIEARAPEAGEGADREAMRVSMTVSGQWGGPK